MRPAIPATKKKQFTNLSSQTERAYRTSVWMLRNAEDAIKPDVKVIHEHLKAAVDEIERLRDRVMEMWTEHKGTVHRAQPADKDKIEAMTRLMPGVAADDAARVISILGEILGAHQHSNRKQ